MTDYQCTSSVSSNCRIESNRIELFFPESECSSGLYNSLYYRTSRDKAIFKMVAVRHLEFAKIAILIKWPISASDSSSSCRNLHKSAIWHRDIAKNDFQYGDRPPSWICKFRFFFVKVLPRNGNFPSEYQFDWKRTIHGWDMEIKLFWKWRPSAILNFRKSVFWSYERHHRTWFCFILQNCALIGQSFVEI